MNFGQQARVAEARSALSQLGFQPQQANERSALCLLCLLDLRPDRPWASADGSTLWRTHELMQWLRDFYDTDYAANTRETIRRQTLHQFVEAGLALYNPDDPDRPVNSPANCYQIAPAALELLRAFDASDFNHRVLSYLSSKPGLEARAAATRGMRLMPVTLGDGTKIELTAGGQNILIKAIVEEFCPRWSPGGHVLYVGDAGKRDPIFDAEALEALGLSLDKHGKLPDLVVHLADRDWLVLLEAARSHGPVDSKRHAELSQLFRNASAGLVFVSCFPSRAQMRKYLADIAWETEAWCADAPDHLVHFNGERFLGPYPSGAAPAK